MTRTSITHEDAGKPVVAADGEQVGMITEVTQAAAHVDPDPGLTDAIRSKLGWETSPGSEGYVLQEAAIEEITDDEVRLKRYG